MSLQFSTDTPIWAQIVEAAYARIISGAWTPGERIPSVRELAVEMAVNSRTVLRAFEQLEQEEVIAPRRGMGYYLAADAPERVLAARREHFFKSTLPAFYAQMRELGLTPADLPEF